MIYFLDFDRTLFDPDAFVVHLIGREGGERLAKPTEEALRAATARFIESGGTTLAPGELRPFVYKDVPEFLRAFGNEAIILTFGDPTLQRRKVENALAGIPRISALYTGDMRKGEFMKDRIAAYGSSISFVDDRPIELESMATHCPQVRLFEMRRDGATGDGRWPVVRSLTELL